MGLKPSQGELNAALLPIFSHIPNAHMIHDDLIVAAITDEDHDRSVELCMQAISEAGLTLNAAKCQFSKKEISFWGMIYGEHGVKPDPTKVEALAHLTAPSSKEELISFLCMMQSNSDFIPNFAQKSAKLRDLTKGGVRFAWNEEHQTCFQQLIDAFKKDVLLRYFDMAKPTFVFVDAHITGLGAMLAQGNSIRDAKPVAFASRTTSLAETRYPQLDLEAMSLDFGLRRFRNYLVGSPHVTYVVTDHKPLCSIFNKNQKGSIRTDRIKLRHQDVRYEVVYQEGKLNQADFASRKAKPLQRMTQEEQAEAEELNNLLYILHTTPVMDSIDIANIAKHTKMDKTLSDLSKIIEDGQTWIPKSAETKLRKFEQLIPEITIAGNGIMFKGERIILPEDLQNTAIQLAHRGSHPGQSGIERRLRYHFFFHNMYEKVKQFVENCKDCNLFGDKKICEPIKAHEVPSKCWETVAVDLFGPMPTSRHVVVVQDLASRFPAAKLVKSTRASHVLPALADIYNSYGNPEYQLSDNGPPFNSQAMESFAQKRDIQLKKIPPLHPSANPVETFMKPLGKTMKIAHYNQSSENEALNDLLSNYRDTPHPATGIAPAAMFFRDGSKSTFPRRSISTEQVEKARRDDKARKQERQEKINSSKYRTSSEFQVGDMVMLRNYKKTTKFDPIFLPETCQIVSASDDGRFLTVERKCDGAIFRRHPDDVKVFHGPPDAVGKKNKTSEEEENREWHRLFEQCIPDVNDNYDSEIKDAMGNQEDHITLSGCDTQQQCGEENDDQDGNVDKPGSNEVNVSDIPRRSQRTRKPNTRYRDYVP